MCEWKQMDDIGKIKFINNYDYNMNILQKNKDQEIDKNFKSHSSFVDSFFVCNVLIQESRKILVISSPY